MEKAFLFDVASKIYVATDSAPVDMATYELCCDMIDVTIDISAIYGYLFHFYEFCFGIFLFIFVFQKYFVSIRSYFIPIPFSSISIPFSVL